MIDLTILTKNDLVSLRNKIQKELNSRFPMRKFIGMMEFLINLPDDNPLKLKTNYSCPLNSIKYTRVSDIGLLFENLYQRNEDGSITPYTDFVDFKKWLIYFQKEFNRQYDINFKRENGIDYFYLEQIHLSKLDKP